MHHAIASQVNLPAVLIKVSVLGHGRSPGRDRAVFEHG